MFLRTVSILALLAAVTPAHAEDPATNPTNAPATPDTTSATPSVAPEGNTETPASSAASPATEGNPEGQNTPAGDVATPGNASTDGEVATENPQDGVGTPAQEPVEQEPVKEEPAAAPEADEGGHGGGHAGSFTVEEMWNQSSGPVRAVLGTLLFMLVAAMGVGLERLITLGSARSQSRKLAAEVGALLINGKMTDALAVCAREDMSKSYLGHLLSAGLKEFESREDHYGIEAVERAIEKNAITETASLNKGLNILATVGSTAPFVGLVGTIFGIINAFGQIGAEGGADLTTLAPAIGEALITTAFGIIVAIVGVWLFNYFTAMIGSITNDMAESSQELVDWCHKRIRPDMKSAK